MRRGREKISQCKSISAIQWADVFKSLKSKSCGRWTGQGTFNCNMAIIIKVILSFVLSCKELWFLLIFQPSSSYLNSVFLQIVIPSGSSGLTALNVLDVSLHNTPNLSELNYRDNHCNVLCRTLIRLESARPFTIYCVMDPLTSCGH